MTATTITGSPLLFLHPSRELELDEAFACAVDGRRASLSPEAVEAIDDARAMVVDLADRGARIYGVTTGYGPLATQYVSPERGVELQRRLVYHLATGVGPSLSEAQCRAIVLARASALSKGFSAVERGTVDFLLHCLNDDAVPVMPSLGTVGASGDLTLLAHMTLALMGEGEMYDRGTRRPSGEVLEERGWSPIELGLKEGLALVNGTSAMTGLAVINAIEAERLTRVALALAVLYGEVTGGRRASFGPLVAKARPHAGQRWVHTCMQRMTTESTRLIDDRRWDVLDADAFDKDGIADAQPIPQDPYTFRCVPQLLGAVVDSLAFHRRTATTELNSVTDNPLFDPSTGEVAHGGNFFGQHVSFASDALTNTVITVAGHAERVVARVTDATLNTGLPAFLVPNELGLNSGFMGAQVTATALLAELRTKAAPASIQSIPTNANNQDVVSMGTIAALRASQALDRAFEVVAIEALALVQAMELRGGDGFCAASGTLAAEVRSHSDPLVDDRPLSADIRAVAAHLRSTSCDRALRASIDFPPIPST